MLMTATGRGCFFMTNSKKQRGRIGRRIQTCHCRGYTVRDGEQVAFKRKLYGSYSDPVKATNTLRQMLGDTFITITDVAVESDYYSIPIDDFVDIAISYRINGDSISKERCKND